MKTNFNELNRVSRKQRKEDLIAAQIGLTNKRDEMCLKCCVAAISVAVQDQYRENIAVFITLIVEKLQSLKDRRELQRLKYDVTIRPLDCKGAFYNAYIENTDQRSILEKRQMEFHVTSTTATNSLVAITFKPQYTNCHASSLIRSVRLNSGLHSFIAYHVR